MKHGSRRRPDRRGGPPPAAGGTGGGRPVPAAGGWFGTGGRGRGQGRGVAFPLCPGSISAPCTLLPFAHPCPPPRPPHPPPRSTAAPRPARSAPTPAGPCTTRAAPPARAPTSSAASTPSPRSRARLGSLGSLWCCRSGAALTSCRSASRCVGPCLGGRRGRGSPGAEGGSGSGARGGGAALVLPEWRGFEVVQECKQVGGCSGRWARLVGAQQGVWGDGGWRRGRQQRGPLRGPGRCVAPSSLAAPSQPHTPTSAPPSRRLPPPAPAGRPRPRCLVGRRLPRAPQRRPHRPLPGRPHQRPRTGRGGALDVRRADFCLTGRRAAFDRRRLTGGGAGRTRAWRGAAPSQFCHLAICTPMPPGPQRAPARAPCPPSPSPLRRPC
jgi:hypothetical protein